MVVIVLHAGDGAIIMPSSDLHAVLDELDELLDELDDELDGELDNRCDVDDVVPLVPGLNKVADVGMHLLLAVTGEMASR